MEGGSDQWILELLRNTGKSENRDIIEERKRRTTHIDRSIIALFGSLCPHCPSPSKTTLKQTNTPCASVAYYTQTLSLLPLLQTETASSKRLTPLTAGLFQNTTLEQLHQHILHPSSPFQLICRHALTTTYRAATVMHPLITTLLSPLTTPSSPDGGPPATPSGASLTLLTSVAILLVALIILDTLRRLIAWGTRLALRVVFWAAVVAVAAMVWERGLLETVKGLIVWAGRVWGWSTGMVDVWGRELKRWEEEERRAKGEL